MEASNVQMLSLGAGESSGLARSIGPDAQANPAPASSGIQAAASGYAIPPEESPEPECKRKRARLSEPSGALLELRAMKASTSGDDRLEERLWNVLCCAVCLELPLNSIYQCSQGHLICTQCFNHLLADARLKDEQATCPSCRCSITRESCTRNLAVEKAVREMPGTCKHCTRQLPRMQLPLHENTECEERPVSCGFRQIGCPWRGPYHERSSHETSCIHPKKSGQEVLDALTAMDRQKAEERKLYQSIFSLLSCEKIVFSDLQLKPYRTDEYIHRLFYETSRFAAFNYHFVVKARINDDQKDPTQSCERRLTYQLVLKSKITAPFAVHYLILKVTNLGMLINFNHLLLNIENY